MAMQSVQVCAGGCRSCRRVPRGRTSDARVETALPELDRASTSAETRFRQGRRLDTPAECRCVRAGFRSTTRPDTPMVGGKGEFLIASFPRKFQCGASSEHYRLSGTLLQQQVPGVGTNYSTIPSIPIPTFSLLVKVCRTTTGVTYPGMRIKGPQFWPGEKQSKNNHSWTVRGE